MPFLGSLLSLLSLGSLLVHGLPFEIAETQVVSRSTSDPLRGVNIGGWLVLESYMNSDIMGDAEDQWTFDQTSGAASALQSHWSTWFTEADVAQIAAWGLNAIRIPIGYWAYNNTGTPYISGADAYLEQALGWCRTHGIKAIICAHGMPGSQNGFDNSGKGGTANWITSDNANMKLSVSILETMVKKYGKTSWSDVVFGLEMVNEPIVWDQTSAQEVAAWAEDTYDTLVEMSDNDDLKIIMHDAFVGASNWEQVGKDLNEGCADPAFYLDVHLYQNQEDADSTLNQTQHIQKVCDYKTTAFLANDTNLPIIVGEFTDQTNICVDANGTVTAGTSCSTDGCQCSGNTDTSQWNGYLINATRLFLETEMDVFEANTEGWFLWSYSGPGAWGLENLFAVGVAGPNKITDRLFPSQCT